MRIGIAQHRPALGRLDQNRENHLKIIQKGKEKDVDLLIFPELSLTGYHLLDITYDIAQKVSSEAIQLLIEQADGIDLLFGFVEHSSDHQLFNSAIYASDRKLIHLHRKVYLPTYGMFDEARYFGQGKKVQSFSTRFGRFGLLIGEDAWHLSLPYLLTMDGAELIIVVCNSPVNGVSSEGILTHQSWKTLLTSQAMVHGHYLLFANRVGSEDNYSFYGGSFVMNPFGHIETESPLFQEDLLIADLEMEQVRQARFRMPLLRDEKMELTMRELQRIFQKQVDGKIKDEID